MQKEVIVQRLTYWKSTYEKLQAAYVALIEGGVKSYMIDDRQLSRWDLPDIEKLMEKAEAKINEYENLLAGASRRKAFGVIPRDW